jgi:hypothetical protein
LRAFWYEAQKKKTKKYTKENTLPGWNDVVVWKDFMSPYIPKDIWAEYIQHMMFKHFTGRSQSGTGNQSRQIHCSVITHIDDSVPFISHAKRMVRLILITSILN